MSLLARMTWNETNPVNERLKFIAARQASRETMTDSCLQFGISRTTGYKIAARYARDGPDALRDRSRAPRTHPNQTSPELEAAILRVRKAHPTWGSKKILAVLERTRTDDALPARSTVDAVLKRAGVVRPRSRRRRRQPSTPPLVVALGPNDVWSMDYKGWFLVGDGTRCDPLTINDVFSRASLECRAMVSPKLEDVQQRLERTFWQFGLPSAMLSDGGPPFGSTGLCRLSRLGVWLLRLGIQPVLIQPGRPDQNGRHERFHETLKAETANPPRATIRAQQAAFMRFQPEYNEQRPHEALGMLVPAELYDFSPRSMPSTLPEHEYPDEFEIRRVRRDGSIKWAGSLVFVGEAMRGELIGVEATGEAGWHVHLGPMRLGALHERSRTVVPLAVDVDSTPVPHVPGHQDP
ncbi:MAG: transposase [bacterium]|nr:transposase [bacterium]